MLYNKNYKKKLYIFVSTLVFTQTDVNICRQHLFLVKIDVVYLHQFWLKTNVACDKTTLVFNKN